MDYVRSKFGKNEVKKSFDGIFFAEVSKKNEKLLYKMKVGIKLGKVKKFGIGWHYVLRAWKSFNVTT